MGEVEELEEPAVVLAEAREPERVQQHLRQRQQEHRRRRQREHQQVAGLAAAAGEERRIGPHGMPSR